MDMTRLKPAVWLKEIVANSHLDDADKNVWYEFVPLMGDANVALLLEVIKQNNPDDLNMLTENLRTKLHALKNKDEQAWDAIIEKENAVLADL